MKFRYALALCLMMVIGCDKVDRYPDLTPDKPSENPETPKPPVEEGIVPFTPADVKDGGVAYIWGNSTTIPEITIRVTKDEWNAFLKRFDEYSKCLVCEICVR